MKNLKEVNEYVRPSQRKELKYRLYEHYPIRSALGIVMILISLVSLIMFCDTDMYRNSVERAINMLIATSTLLLSIGGAYYFFTATKTIERGQYFNKLPELKDLKLTGPYVIRNDPLLVEVIDLATKKET